MDKNCQYTDEFCIKIVSVLTVFRLTSFLVLELI